MKCDRHLSALLKGRALPGLVFAFVLAVCGSLLALQPAGAARAVPPIPAIISLLPPDPVPLGGDFLVSGSIRDSLGHPVAGKSILFSINGAYLGQARSDSRGFFHREFSRALEAKIYTLSARSTRTHTLAAASDITWLEVLPAEVRLQTVPALAGVPFELDGRRFISGPDGTASILVPKSGRYTLRVLAEEYRDPLRRIEFGRWTEEVFSSTRQIEVIRSRSIEVGLDVFHLVGQSFIDLQGQPVDARRVKEFFIRSTQGDVFTLSGGQPRWLPASRVSRSASGLFESRLLYSVMSVSMDGSNVVNQSQQRFYAGAGQTWPVALLLYNLDFTASDGLYGHPVGKSVTLRFPDGHTASYPLDANGAVQIPSLARGEYSIELNGASGLKPVTPVSVSRDQLVSIRVITALDLLSAGLFAFLSALGLAVYGRTRLLQAALARIKRYLRSRQPDRIVPHAD